MAKRAAVAAGGGAYLEKLVVDRRGLDVVVGDRVVILSGSMARRTGPGITPELTGVVLAVATETAVVVEFREEDLREGLPVWWRIERRQILRKV